jgi:tetratricopeptide (TPR) repeat protein
MKKIIIVLLLALPFTVMAQTQPGILQLLRYRKYTSAENETRRISKAEPMNTANWYWLSQVLSQEKDSIALLDLLKQFPAGINDDAWLKIAKGNIALQSGNAAGARQYFDEAVSATRGKDKAILSAVARANIYSPAGDKMYALEVLKKAIKRDKKDPELYTLQGDAYFRLKDGSQAYQAFEYATKLDPAYAPALYELGKIFATQNNEEFYLKYFTATVAADPLFAPALYDLYYHYYKKDITKAWDYFTKYMAVADVEPSDEYQLADMLYLTKQYAKAIAKANALLTDPQAPARLNKLIAYTYKETGKPDSAIVYMNRYFEMGADSSYLLKDYEFMIGLFSDKKGYEDSVAAYYTRMLPLLKDKAAMNGYYQKLAAYYKERKDYRSQAVWLEKYYTSSEKATNVDLFNWGVSLYNAREYQQADSVFGLYSQKYPEHVFGYYWQARSNAVIDSTMEQSLAIPYYKKLVEVAEKDTANETNKRYLVEAYGYIAAYTANEEKNYKAAIGYFNRLLEIDPANSDAKKYIEILQRSLNAEEGTK